MSIGGATRFELSEADIPTRWYNVVADMPSPPPPPLHPATGRPPDPQDLLAIFPPDLVEQEVSSERHIAIPEPVLDIYRLWRPTPLYRARRLERALETPAHIYYKYEGVSPAGSHKPNTAVPQAYYNRRAGIGRLTTETGAGQWGSALAFAARSFDLDIRVYMVRVSYGQKPYRRLMMETWGAEVVASPSTLTASGRGTLDRDPDSPGSLGIAISEAVEEAASRKDTNYSLGSVLNHVLLHQTVIGQEARKQFDLAGDYPDVVVASCGGGSNFAGLAFPFLGERLTGNAPKETRFVAVEPAACPTLTRGIYAYDFGDASGFTPLMKMFTLGHGFVPPGIHAGGLRYHGDSPLVSKLVADGLVEAQAYGQVGVFSAAVQFARSEGIIPAPESAHAIKGAVEEALAAKRDGAARTILFGLSGHGHFDLAAYEQYLSGALQDFELPTAAIDQALKELPAVDRA